MRNVVISRQEEFEERHRSLLSAPEHVQQQYLDNKRWIEGAAENRLVVGSQARILYSDQEGRVALALAFNEAVRSGRVSVS